jgi:hypothetical protein
MAHWLGIQKKWIVTQVPINASNVLSMILGCYKRNLCLKKTITSSVHITITSSVHFYLFILERKKNTKLSKCIFAPYFPIIPFF